MNQVEAQHVVIYATEQGTVPFEEWLGKLDPVARRRTLARIRRLESGNFGDCASVGKGVHELRLFFGPGYRVYFGKDEDGNIVILLCGGDKKSQKRDVQLAQVFWKEYLNDKALSDI